MGSCASAVAISATALPLPTGAATETTLAAATTRLANIDVDIGATSDTSATDDSGSWSLIALFKRLLRFGAALASVSSNSKSFTLLISVMLD